MGRYRRNSDAALVEGIAALVGLVFLLAIFNPALVPAITGLCILAVGMVVLLIVGLVVFKVYRSRRRGVDSTIPSQVDDFQAHFQTLKASVLEARPYNGPKAKATSPQAGVADFQTLKTVVPEARPYDWPRITAAAPEPAPTASPPKRITQDDLRAIDWFQFEKVIAALYEAAGEYRVERRGGANPDGGVDLVLHRDNELIAVQCKHWKVWNVGVRHLREFFGGMKAAGFDRGIFVTLCGYTGEARKFADDNGIVILNAKDIETMLDRYDARNNGEIRSILDDPTKHCPKCGAEMVIRTARRGPEPGSQFWACTRYPRCNGKMRLTD